MPKILSKVYTYAHILGEGIHHAMEGGKIAAIFLDEALNHGNYDSDCMKIFHSRWMSKFGFDFKWYITIVLYEDLKTHIYRMVKRKT